MTTAYASVAARLVRGVTRRQEPRIRTLLARAVSGFIWLPMIAAAAEPSLYERVKSAVSCEQSEANGRYCEYKLDGVLEIGIKNVGGANTVVGFRHSNVDAELYAVLYGGCIAIVPGKSNKTAHHRDYGVFISPKDGVVYRTSVQCEHSLK